MDCQRCGGFMVSEWCVDSEMVAWRCVQCGEVIDPVIVSNRERSLATPMELALSAGGASK